MARGRTPKQDIGPADLELVVEKLSERLMVLRTIQKSMERQQKKSINVDGTVMLDKTYGYIDTFIHSCKKELGMP